MRDKKVNLDCFFVTPTIKYQKKPRDGLQSRSSFTSSPGYGRRISTLLTPGLSNSHDTFLYSVQSSSSGPTWEDLLSGKEI